jgi:hypothetical protein
VVTHLFRQRQTPYYQCTPKCWNKPRLLTELLLPTTSSGQHINSGESPSIFYQQLNNFSRNPNIESSPSHNRKNLIEKFLVTEIHWMSHLSQFVHILPAF